MGSTPIEWTATVNADGSVTPGKVWNPVTGCHKVSPGCKHCYAEGIAKRFWKTQYPPVLVNPLPDQFRTGAEAAAGEALAIELEAAGDTRPREFTDVQCHPDRLTEPFSWKKPCKVFVNSMSDLFEEAVPFEFIAAVFAVMAYCDRHIFQVLTKRPDRMRDFMEWVNAPEGSERISELYGDRAGQQVTMARMHRVDEDIAMRVWGFDDSGVDLNACLHNNGVWPPENVWLGVSVENQKYADERIPLLLQTPAAVRFISYEPALGPVELTYNRMCGAMGWGPPSPPRRPDTPPEVTATDQIQQVRWVLGPSRISWVIVGGESGPGARPFDIAWARSIVQQCAAAGVACFVKQLGANPGFWEERVTGNAYGDCDDDSTWHPFATSAGKGGDMAEWPEDLRVRQFPEART